MKKKVLLAMTADSNIYKCVIDNLNYINLDCYTLVAQSAPKRKLRRKNNFKLKYYKIFDKKKYLQNLCVFTQEKKIKNFLTRENDFDCCLMIRPDLFPKKIVTTILSSINETYAYQWDSLDRFPQVLEYVEKFKKFYIYDKNDLNKHNNTSLVTNFYFDCYSHLNKNKPKYDVYYLGVYDERIDDIIEVCKNLQRLGMKMNILIFCPEKHMGKLSKYPYITELYRGISYMENLENVFDSNIILDFGHNKLHNGLSLRPFEALGHKKKLITTNKGILEYDFYTDNNIFYYDIKESTIDQLKLFLESDFKNIDADIYRKHSFSGWFKRLYS